MLIRRETEADHSAVQKLLLSAFDEEGESKLVTRLRVNAEPLISLVAELDGKIIGHILFSPVTLDTAPSLAIMGLAPMAVLPNHQGRGVGTALVEAGLKRCREQNFGAVVVLGHPKYYPRFGFRASSDYNIKCEYDVSAAAFMLIELIDGYLQKHSGTARYHEEFMKL